MWPKKLSSHIKGMSWSCDIWDLILFLLTIIIFTKLFEMDRVEFLKVLVWLRGDVIQSGANCKKANGTNRGPSHPSATWAPCCLCHRHLWHSGRPIKHVYAFPFLFLRPCACNLSVPRKDEPEMLTVIISACGRVVAVFSFCFLFAFSAQACGFAFCVVEKLWKLLNGGGTVNQWELFLWKLKRQYLPRSQVLVIWLL